MNALRLIEKDWETATHHVLSLKICPKTKPYTGKKGPQLRVKEPGWLGPTEVPELEHKIQKFNLTDSESH